MISSPLNERERHEASLRLNWRDSRLRARSSTSLTAAKIFSWCSQLEEGPQTGKQSTEQPDRFMVARWRFALQALGIHRALQPHAKANH